MLQRIRCSKKQFKRIDYQGQIPLKCKIFYSKISGLQKSYPVLWLTLISSQFLFPEVMQQKLCN